MRFVRIVLLEQHAPSIYSLLQWRTISLFVKCTSLTGTRRIFTGYLWIILDYRVSSSSGSLHLPFILSYISVSIFFQALSTLILLYSSQTCKELRAHECNSDCPLVCAWAIRTDEILCGLRILTSDNESCRKEIKSAWICSTSTEGRLAVFEPCWPRKPTHLLFGLIYIWINVYIHSI